MKPIYPLAVLAAAFVLAGCDESKLSRQSDADADRNAPPAQEQATKTETTALPPAPAPAEIAKQEPKEPADVTPYPSDLRDQFVAFQTEHLASMDQSINELSDKIMSLNTDEVALQTLNSMRELRSQVDPLFEELKKASPEAWDDAKQAYEMAFAELDRVYQDAKETYGD